MRLHQQQVEFSVGDFVILLDSLYKTTFWNRCKVAQIEALGLNRNNNEKYAVCRVMVRSGQMDPGNPTKGIPPHPKFRPCYILRSLASLSLPLVRGQELKNLKTCEDLVDLDSRYWIHFARYLSNRDWDEARQERARYVLPAFTEAAPTPSKPLKEYIIKFDSKSRAFRLKLSQSDWDQIFSDPLNEWPDVNIDVDEDGNFEALDDYIATEEFRDDTPDPRLTRAKAQQEREDQLRQIQ